MVVGKVINEGRYRIKYNVLGQTLTYLLILLRILLFNISLVLCLSMGEIFYKGE